MQDGELFVFLDADTTLCSPSAITIAVSYLIEHRLDALTARPKIICENIWTKIIMPMLWTFSHIKFSSLHINNSQNKIGYFFGCFYLITRRTYESIGTHEAVKNEIVEDAPLGQKVKQQKLSKLKMVRGEHYVSTKNGRRFYDILGRSKKKCQYDSLGQGYNQYLSSVFSVARTIYYVTILSIPSFIIHLKVVT